ncbi:DNA-directed RNA polymerase [Synchytrium endobioticum]|uniref:DNA-directed RNA polymerases I and III subunit RPAC2 n=1 Tax=Synchytrium endobioticum TaxID=286115 RepID=A0A507DJB6_9FUNG|nr:DNA-directed RNA polymerase [Synchytrium endobioticum]TPX53418.1 DNA-directed RNA polymerase [Synchytrium endobioticum]
MAMIEPNPALGGNLPPLVGPKISLLQSDNDGSTATFVILQEDHTLGNPLRHIILKNPAVEFCAYTVPHPSEAKIHIRIQTDGSRTATQALDKGLNDLIAVTEHIQQLFRQKAQPSYEP